MGIDIDLEYLCTEICEVLEANGITDDDVPELWSMIERFAGAVLKKYNKAKAVVVEERED